jgi:hypothetical protein
MFGNTPADLPHCPKCRSIMSLWRVAPSPSVNYEAHTFDCANCGFRYTARIDTPVGIIRTLRVKRRLLTEVV